MSITNIATTTVTTLLRGRVVALGGQSGRLSVVDGRVWLTRVDDPDDHVLGAGESIEIGDAHGTVVEPWHGVASVSWLRDGIFRSAWRRLALRDRRRGGARHNARFIEKKDEEPDDGNLFRSRSRGR